jgi:hypothetical protein
MGEIIIPNAIKRRKGFLYYVDGEGNVCEAEMQKGTKSKPEVTELMAKEEDGEEIHQ